MEFTDSVKKKDIKLSEERFGVGMRMRKDYADLKFLYQVRRFKVSGVCRGPDQIVIIDIREKESILQGLQVLRR